MNDQNIIVRCNNCGTKNRIPADRMGDNPVCGRCHVPLQKGPIYDHPVDVTDKTFNQEVLSQPGVVLVDCWAPWCGPCRMVGPVLDQLAREYAGRVKIAKLNVDENPSTASQYMIQSIPTMLFYKNGQKVNTLIGALPKAEIEKNIRALI